MNTKRLIKEFLLLIEKKQIPLYCNREGEPFIEVPLDPEKRPWPLRSKTVQAWIHTESFQELAFAPTPGAVDAVLKVLEGYAWKNFPKNTGDASSNEADPILLAQIKERNITLS